MDSVLELRVVSYRDPDAVALVARVQEEYVDRYGGPDETPVDPSMFDPPEGLFMVAYLDGVPVGTGAWRRTPVLALGGSLGAEIKRMYVVPERRGSGLARRILAELENTAVAAGHDLIVLETGLMQPEAIALYESSGYLPIAGFGHYAASELNRCFAKRL